MELRLDPEQVDLQDTVARLFADRYPLDAVVAREGAALDRAVWRELVDVGIPGLLLDEAAGGSGLGVLEAALVFEQVGSHLVPGPLRWTTAAAGLVEGAATGDRVVTGIDADAIDGDGSAVVEHATDADVLVVLHADRVTAHATADLPAPEVLVPLDPLTSIARVASLGDGEVVGGADDGARLRVVATVLAAAELAGVAGRALKVARDHALERQQFGVPIGSFQAVKHLLADAYLGATLAQSAVYAAAAVADDPADDDPLRAARRAKLVAADAAIEGAGTAIQVLGGMGFTWEMLPHHLLKRAWHLEDDLGRQDDLAAALGSRLVEVTR